jgi:hypothetical protein
MSHWHLHITVKPHWNWTFVDVTEALKRDVERHSVKPLVITNHFHDGVRESYKELIPSKTVEGDEASASREIFRLGVLLNNAGWRIQRLKIEGDPREESSVASRALYFETHLKNAPLPLRAAPISTTAKGNTFHTVRAPRLTDILTRLWSWEDEWPHMKGFKCEMEACVLDTNPQLDDEWMNQ